MADLPEVMAIERLAYAFPWSPGNFKDCLAAGYECLLVEGQGRIMAYAVMSVAAGEAHLLNLCVRPQQQRCGLGRKLLGRLLDQARALGADTMFLEVRVSNQAAITLYRSLGFNEIGLRRSYYPAAQGREDAMMMALTLHFSAPFS